MEKNQLIKYHGTIYRVLAVEDGSMLLIDCMERKMPKWHRIEDIDGYEDCTEEQLVSTAGIILTEERDLKPKARCAARERYTVVAGVLPFIADDRLRTEVIKRIAEEKEICTQTVRNYLCQYLSFQSISALVPQERGR
ncbi:MAG: hypothetical protein K2G55_09550, partial [Lachnospiraceae bacterium]|nr:hypothetical protein [Lachnospiraceae bacterium]